MKDDRHRDGDSQPRQVRRSLLGDPYWLDRPSSAPQSQTEKPAAANTIEAHPEAVYRSETNLIHVVNPPRLSASPRPHVRRGGTDITGAAVPGGRDDGA